MHVDRRPRADELMDERDEPSHEVRHVLRRQTSRGRYEFVDDRGDVLGLMRRRFYLNSEVTRTDTGTFRNRGLVLRRMYDEQTGDAIFSRRRARYRLPGGAPLSEHLLDSGTKRRGRSAPQERRLELRDSGGVVIIALSWLGPRGGMASRAFTLGRADLFGLQPSAELVPLLSWSFFEFQMKSISGGGY
jgi:hypothetical protein